MENTTSATPRTRSEDSTAGEPDLTGLTFDDFHVLRQLGEGGMGRVYLAEQISLKRKVAIKVLRQDTGAPTALPRFRAESQTIAQLCHPNIVQAYMVGEYAGCHYMVLEYVEGVSLRQYLTKKGPLPTPLVLSIMRQIASALQRAGEMGILHRDIKPENILLTRKGEVKVADFGLARSLNRDETLDLTRAGSAVGTPRYMSPEQLEGKPVDQRTDIYSFGITCYEMLTGKRPFDGDNAYEIALKHVREEPAPLESLRSGVPPKLCGMVHKMLEKDPDTRYASCQSLLKDIARVRESLDGTAASMQTLSIAGETTPHERFTATTARRSKRPARRRLWLALGAGAGAAVLLLVGVVVAFYLSRPAGPVAPSPTPPATLPIAVPKPPDTAQNKELEALKQRVEQFFKDTVPSSSGVEACMNLGVNYLDAQQVPEAEALFKRMSERRLPPACSLVGRLGLAVTDFLKNDKAAARNTFKDLFEPDRRDFERKERVKILHEYLNKNAKFDDWVKKADVDGLAHRSSDIPHGVDPKWGGGKKYGRP